MFTEELFDLLGSDELKEMRIKKQEIKGFKEIVQNACYKYLKQKVQEQQIGENIKFTIYDSYIEESTILKRLGIKVYPHRVTGSTRVFRDAFSPGINVPNIKEHTNISFPTSLFTTTTKEQAIS